MNSLPYNHLTDEQVTERGEARSRRIDRAMGRYDLPGELEDFDAMTDDELDAYNNLPLYATLSLPGRSVEPLTQPAPSPLQSIAPAPRLQQPERVPLTARQLGLPSYPAKVWDSQLRRMVHIGVFRTMVDRDQAIAAAKQRRSMGLPVKPIGPTDGR